jgi:GT2 family glycosyltransferase
VRIYVICPVYNRKNVTKNFLNQMHQQTYKNITIVFIDSGSKDGTVSMIENYDFDSRVVKGNENWWWARSVNEGLKYIKTLNLAPDDIVGIINDDVIFNNIYIENVDKYLNKAQDVLLGSKLVNQDGIIESGIFFDKRTMKFVKTDHSINCSSTRGLFFKYSLLPKIGLMRQNLFPHYFSDYDLTLRANYKGLEIKFTPDVYINLHLDTQSKGKSNNQNTRLLSNANASNIVRRLIFITSHCPISRLPILYAKEIKNIVKKTYEK